MIRLDEGKNKTNSNFCCVQGHCKLLEVGMDSIKNCNENRVNFEQTPLLQKICKGY